MRLSVAHFVALIIGLSLSGDAQGHPVIQPRIVNPDGPAGKHEFPFQVSLQLKHSEQNESFHICGATIIGKHYALTAAHCLFRQLYPGLDLWLPTNPSDIRLMAGSAHLTDRSKDAYFVEVENYTIHENYDENGGDDIAVIRVKTPFITNKKFSKSVKLDKKGKDLTKGKATIIGWGAIDNKGTGAKQLLKAKVSLQPQKVCNKVDIDWSKVICAGGEGQSTACYGDSGGPMIRDGKQIGIASFRIPSPKDLDGCDPSTPFGYTKVSSYAKWIAKKTGLKI